jgi:hypothetical protein
MNLFQIKLKRGFYLTLSTVFLFSIFSGIFITFFSVIPNKSIGSFIGILLLSLVVCFLAFVILALIENKIRDYDYMSFMGGILFISKRNKFVFHNELGYFICIVQEDRITVHDQKLFYMKDIVNIQNTGTSEQIARKIKNGMDKEYKSRVEEIQEKKRIKAQLDEVAKWDGFLDVESRRDEKIKKLIK